MPMKKPIFWAMPALVYMLLSCGLANASVGVHDTKQDTHCQTQIASLASLSVYGHAEDSMQTEQSLSSSLGSSASSSFASALGTKRTMDSSSDNDPMKASKVRKTLDVFKVVDYFLSKAKCNGKTIDPLKLQKMLYYAQGYSWGSSQQRLFSADLTHNFHGAFVREVHNQYKGCGPIASSKQIDLSSYSEDNKWHLDTVYMMKIGFTGKELEHENHKEDPWKDTKPGEIISDARLLSFFKQPKQILDYCESALKAADNLDVFVKITKILQSCAGSLQVSPEIVQFNDLFENPTWYANQVKNKIDNHINTLIKEMIIHHWPNQTLFDTWVAYIFFPESFIALYDSPVVLCDKVQNLYRLAYSGRYGNPLAYYYMSRYFGYFATDTGIQHEECRVTDYQAELQTKIDTLLQKVNDQLIGYQPYPLGFLYDACGQKSIAKSVWERGDKAGDVRSTAALKQYQKAYEGGYKPALIAIARSSKSHEEAFGKYCEAGKNGVASGYYYAAKMIERQEIEQSLGVAIDYAEKAASSGVVAAYDLLGAIYRHLGQEDNMLRAHEAKANAGFKRGYFDLGQYYEENKKLDKAREFFVKMDTPTGYENALRLTNDLEQRRELQDKLRDSTSETFGQLTQLYQIILHQETDQ